MSNPNQNKINFNEIMNLNNQEEYLETLQDLLLSIDCSSYFRRTKREDVDKRIKEREKEGERSNRLFLEYDLHKHNNN